jgi:hypothetical protein
MNDNEKKIYKIIAKMSHNSIVIDRKDILALEVTEDEMSKAILQLLREGFLYEPLVGYLSLTDQVPPEDVQSSLITPSTSWFNPDSLNWEIKTPTASASKKKGSYWWTNSKMSDLTYKEIAQKLNEKIAIGGHSIYLSEWGYWFNFNGGIARRPLTKRKWKQMVEEYSKKGIAVMLPKEMPKE